MFAVLKRDNLEIWLLFIQVCALPLVYKQHSYQSRARFTRANELLSLYDALMMSDVKHNNDREYLMLKRTEEGIRSREKTSKNCFMELPVLIERKQCFL